MTFAEELKREGIYVGKLELDLSLTGISVDKETFIRTAKITAIAVHKDKPDQEIYGKKFGDVTYKDFELYMTSWNGVAVFYTAPNE